MHCYETKLSTVADEQVAIWPTWEQSDAMNLMCGWHYLNQKYIQLTATVLGESENTLQGYK